MKCQIHEAAYGYALDMTHVGRTLTLYFDRLENAEMAKKAIEAGESEYYRDGVWEIPGTIRCRDCRFMVEGDTFIACGRTGARVHTWDYCSYAATNRCLNCHIDGASCPH